MEKMTMNAPRMVYARCGTVTSKGRKATMLEDLMYV